MDPLSDWHRYVDQHSRPASRRSAGEDSVSGPWRPWMEEPEDAAPAESIAAGVVPELELGLDGVEPPAHHPVGRRYRDLTVHDSLEPIPLFSVPSLEAPALEFNAPRIRQVLRRGGDVAEPEPQALSAPVAVMEAVREAVVAAPPAEPSGAQALQETAETESETARLNRLRRHWESLSETQARDTAQRSYKAPFQESREALLQRLLDPEMTLEETARLLDVCPTTVRRYTNRGMLRHFRTPGNQRRFRLSDVLEFMERRKAMTASELAEADSA